MWMKHAMRDEAGGLVETEPTADYVGRHRLWESTHNSSGDQVYMGCPACVSELHEMDVK
jgi:hypothetical protein